MQQFMMITKTSRVLKEPISVKGKLRKTKTVNVSIPAIHPEHYQMILDFFTDERMKLTIRILMGSGLRYEEIKQISKDSFFPDNNSVLIKSEKVEAVAGFRYCYLSKQAAEAVKTWIEQGYKPLTRDGFYKNLKLLEAGTGIKISSKSFRKSHENWRLNAGHDFYKVGVDMGHTSRVLIRNYFADIPWSSEQIELMKEIIK